MNKDIMRAAGFGAEVERFENGLCVLCSKPVVIAELRNDMSRSEYEISGMCQTCQDGVWKPEDQQ